MKFDPKTGKLIMPGKIKQETLKSEEIQIIDPSKEESTLPTTKATCPKCGHTEAYYWIQQTRASDEPETKFLKCTKCKHTSRDYS